MLFELHLHLIHLKQDYLLSQSEQRSYKAQAYHSTVPSLYASTSSKMPPAIIRESMVQDLLDFIREAIPIIYEASTELLELILENDPSTSAVATSHRRWIHINLMRQLLPLEEEERQEWLIDLFSGRQNTAEYFAETMLLSGIWTEFEDENGFMFYGMHRLKEINFRNWLLRPEIQEIYENEVMELLPRILKNSIEGSDYIPKRGPKSGYKIVVPDWKKEIIATKQELAVSQSRVEDLKEEIRRANDVIASQASVIEWKDKQLRIERMANVRSEKVWVKRYRKFFKRT
ncbi:hypothetical protein OCU04_002069 [Sclerotinia nivalis]|uniref:Uncharacterized protein n=1 Tax=Sclerotinia nivalis TaxID=352851 RepID=A0A9X0B043_9HELO|nr:hypothetical protein OCU04_002069 [Sclerotinia nivalis]